MVSQPGELVGMGDVEGSWVVLDVEAKAGWVSRDRGLMREGMVVGVDISEELLSFLLFY